jgi:hypothetical protein
MRSRKPPKQLISEGGLIIFVFVVVLLLDALNLPLIWSLVVALAIGLLLRLLLGAAILFFGVGERTRRGKGPLAQFRREHPDED